MRLVRLTLVVVCLGTLASCATIVGGSNYNAHVYVVDHPKASVHYKNSDKGYGSVSFPVPRKEAADFSFTVQEKGCEEQVFAYTQKKFRGWAFTGSLLFFTGNIGTVPFPTGLIVDGITGAWWKPDKKERGVEKVNLNNYSYRVEYTGCDNFKATD